ncbi:hypothetical protein J6590_074608 [Homalodisca vitripennis]|nr:hypothetical protein J6590_074608 [Homalodisca vitripennis]
MTVGVTEPTEPAPSSGSKTAAEAPPQTKMPYCTTADSTSLVCEKAKIFVLVYSLIDAAPTGNGPRIITGVQPKHRLEWFVVRFGKDW